MTQKQGLASRRGASRALIDAARAREAEAADKSRRDTARRLVHAADLRAPVDLEDHIRVVLRQRDENFAAALRQRDEQIEKLTFDLSVYKRASVEEWNSIAGTDNFIEHRALRAQLAAAEKVIDAMRSHDVHRPIFQPCGSCAALAAYDATKGKL